MLEEFSDIRVFAKAKGRDEATRGARRVRGNGRKRMKEWLSRKVKEWKSRRIKE